MNKNIKKIIIFLLIISLVGFLAFLFFFKKPLTPSDDGMGVFFPFGESPDVSLGGEDQNGDVNIVLDDEIINDEAMPILRQITSSPVAGVIVFKNNEDTNRETEYVIRYMEKITGHIYETTTDSQTLNRISNTTIPQVRDALWLDKDSLIVRYLDDDIIKTFLAELSMDDSGEQKLEGVLLQDNIKEIIQLEDKLFYLLEGGSGSLGIISDLNGENKKSVFESVLTEWLINAIDNTNISFSTKPASNVHGFLFFFNTKTNSFEKVLGNELGLSTLSNKVSDILYLANNSFGPGMHILNDKSGATTQLPLISFPEKCVWSNDNIHIYCGVPVQKLQNNSLDEWYKGKISFFDDVWKINTETNTAEFIISPRKIGSADIDIIKISLTETGSGEYLSFINKKDFSLWNLRLNKDL